MPFAADRTHVGGVFGQVQAVDILFRCPQAFKRFLGFLPPAVMAVGKPSFGNLLVVPHCRFERLLSNQGGVSRNLHLLVYIGLLQAFDSLVKHI